MLIGPVVLTLLALVGIQRNEFTVPVQARPFGVVGAVILRLWLVVRHSA